jgi:hypothetical protein
MNSQEDSPKNFFCCLPSALAGVNANGRRRRFSPREGSVPHVINGGFVFSRDVEAGEGGKSSRAWQKLILVSDFTG